MEKTMTKELNKKLWINYLNRVNQSARNLTKPKTFRKKRSYDQPTYYQLYCTARQKHA